MSSTGTISIRPLAANLQHDVDLFGKMDPYCLITLGTQQWKSMVSKNGGKTPSWSDEVTFMVQPGVDIMRIALYDDKLIGSDKLIGEGVLPVDKLFSYNGPFEEKIPLTFKAKPVGFIQLRFLVVTGEQQVVNQLQQQQQVYQGYEQHSPKIVQGAAQNIPQTSTGQHAQQFIEKFPQEAIPAAGAATFTSQSVQFGPKAAEFKQQLQQSGQQLQQSGQDYLQQQQGQLSSSGQQLFGQAPQCCENATQPGIVPGSTGYTGEIPHHHRYQN